MAQLNLLLHSDLLSRYDSAKVLYTKNFRLHQWKKPIQKRIFCCIVWPQTNALSIINEYFLFGIDKTWWGSRQCDSFVYSIYIFNESTYWVSCQCREYSIPYKVFSGICKSRVLWKYLIIFWIMHTNLISTQNRLEKIFLLYRMIFYFLLLLGKTFHLLSR